MARFLLPLLCLLVAPGVWSVKDLQNEKLTTNLMKALTKEGENMVISPVSLGSALGAVGFGAKGQTMEQIFTTLGYNPSQAKPAIAQKQQLLHDWRTKGATWEFADRIMASPDYPLRQDYVDEVNQTFPGIEVDNFDFGSPAKTADDINSWVANKTHQVIENFIDPYSVLANTRVVVLNAAYFKGEWKQGFNKSKTTSDCFYPIPNQCSVTNMMHTQASIKYGLYDVLSAQVIELPYENEEFSMIFVLPDKRHDLMSLLPHLNVDNLIAFIDGKKNVKVDVTIPRFQAEFDDEMKQTLSDMGMDSLFSHSPDLSGMFSVQGAYVDSVKHKAKINCNEDGTVTADTTDIHIRSEKHDGDYSEEFTAERPFMYLIRNKEAGVLFSGTFSSP